MTYTVVVMPAAQDEMDEAYAWLLSQTLQHAPLWYNGLLDSLYSLENNPARCPLAPESKDAPDEIRQLLYGDRRHAYRILFCISGERVLILHIRHAARRSL